MYLLRYLLTTTSTYWVVFDAQVGGMVQSVNDGPISNAQLAGLLYAFIFYK